MSAFVCVDWIAYYLHAQKPDISPLKLQKSLYLLFAYFGAFYSQDSLCGEHEGSARMPDLLFDAEFEAWQSGPVIREVWIQNKAGIYTLNAQMKEEAATILSANQEAKAFVDDIFSQILAVSDFTLSDLCKQDQCWKDAFRSSSSKIMDHGSIFSEYKRVRL